MVRENKTFSGGDPFWANACVGNNGFPGYWEYAIGFSQAAKLLIDIVLHDKSAKYSVDVFVYPVCFNMRHSVELRLKGAISELISIELIRDRKLEFDLAGSHDIGNIWRFFAEKSISIDDRYTTINACLEAKISDIAEIDATGQTFRYPLDTKSQKHLVDVGNINFVNLKKSFFELETALYNLHLLNIYLHTEYEVNTFTKNLSRKKIFEIASKLPNRCEWSKASFDTIKRNIKEQFEIGSKELSDSIKIIESNFELAPMIGMTKPLLGVSDGNIIEFMNHWFKLHDLPSDTEPIDLKTNDGSDAFFESIDRDAEICNKIWHSLESKLTPEVLAGFSALFYYARDDLKFSERYVHIYESELQEATTVFEKSREEVRLKLFHIFNKTTVPFNFLRSLYFLKKSELAERLISLYGLDSKFSWLDEARSGVLFKKPDYCGYTI
ncbi:MAG: hypothetical protein DU489_12160 [Nitrosomonas sp.]